MSKGIKYNIDLICIYDILLYDIKELFQNTDFTHPSLYN